MKKKNRIGTVFIYLIFIVLCLAILYPFLCVLSVSLSSAEDIKLYGFRVLPKHLDFSAYSYLFRDSKMLWQAYGTTIFVSVVGTAIGCLVTSLYAYAISRTTFRWRGVLSLFVTFTMFFSGGMAAQYITYVKLLNLKNSIWVLILPGAFSAMNTIIMRAYYEKLPYSMIESAKIDGASEYQIFWRMMFPLAKPALATICLTLFVAYWNAYYEAMMYMDTGNYVTIQLLLQRMLEKVDFLKNNASTGLLGAEAAKLPDYVPDGARLVQICALCGDDGHEISFAPGDIERMMHTAREGENILYRMYRQMLFGNKAFKELFRALEAGETPILFHCSAGKDRTGVAAMLILLALGASDETICADFVQTNVCRKAEIDALLAGHAEEIAADPSKRMRFCTQAGVDPGAAPYVLQVIREACGSAEEYLAREYGLTPARRMRLRRMYLE